MYKVHFGTHGKENGLQIAKNTAKQQTTSFDMSALAKNFNSGKNVAQFVIGEQGLFPDGYTFYDQILLAPRSIALSYLPPLAHQSPALPITNASDNADSDPNGNVASSLVTINKPVSIEKGCDSTKDYHVTQLARNLPVDNGNSRDTSMSSTTSPTSQHRGVVSPLHRSIQRSPAHSTHSGNIPHIQNSTPGNKSVTSIFERVDQRSSVDSDSDDDIPLSQLRRVSPQQSSTTLAEKQPSGKTLSKGTVTLTKSPKKPSAAPARKKCTLPSPHKAANVPRSQKRQRTLKPEEDNGVLPSPKKPKTALKKINATPSKKASDLIAKSPLEETYSDSTSSDDSSEFADDENDSDFDTTYSSQRAESYSPSKTHRNFGRDRKPGFTDEEYDAVFDAVYARRSWENANQGVVPLRDQPFWECILKTVHSKNQCMSRKTWGSLKNFWNRIGRERSQFEERVNGGKNGKLTASIQKKKVSKRR